MSIMTVVEGALLNTFPFDSHISRKFFSIHVDIFPQLVKELGYTFLTKFVT
jgi:hypothetical protein